MVVVVVVVVMVVVVVVVVVVVIVVVVQAVQIRFRSDWWQGPASVMPKMSMGKYPITADSPCQGGGFASLSIRSFCQ